MPYSDGELRKLAPWLPGWEPLDIIKTKIKDLWSELRALRIAADEIRKRQKEACPLSLSSLEVRLWSKVEIIDDEDSCWEWTKSRGPLPDNYGKFGWTNPITGKREVLAASRVVLFLSTGELPDHACHACDNPPCCRPKHLYSGTHLTNMQDRSTRGRYGGWTRRNQSGERNSQAKLTEATVVLARDLARAGMKLKDIHDHVGYTGSQTVLRFAITGQTWKHLNDASPPVLKR